MKKIICAVIAAALCLSLLCACGNSGSSDAEASSKASAAVSAAQQGNESAFNLSESHLQSVLACAWVNQNDFNEKIKFDEGLGFIHFIKGKRFSGKAELNENSGLLTMKYDDDARPEQTYVWVDKLSNVSAGTWYVDGGTFACGGTVFVKDVEF